MSNTYISIYVGYFILFILLILMTKLYEREWKLRTKAEMQYMDLQLLIEIAKMERKKSNLNSKKERVKNE